MGALAWLAEPLRHDFMIRAMLVGSFVGVVCATLSCFVVLMGWSLVGDALSHAVLPGIILAYLAGLPMAQRSREFAWVWTVQEACVKAAGTGFAGRPWSIDVPARAAHGRWGRYRWRSLRGVSPVPFSCAFVGMEAGAR